MNAYSALADFLRRRPNQGQAASPARLLPPLDADSLPPGFEAALELQALGYRDRLAMVRGQRRRAVDPVWTVASRDW